MTADLTLRLGEIGTVLAKRMPLVLDAGSPPSMQSVDGHRAPASSIDTAHSEHDNIRHPNEAGGTTEVRQGRR